MKVLNKKLLSGVISALLGVSIISTVAFAGNSKSNSAKSAKTSSEDWLHTDGNRILDSEGKQVWLTGVNWFGYNCNERVFHGLWSASLDQVVKGIADHGFNLIRVPIAAALINEWEAGVFESVNVNTYANPELEGKNSLEIFDIFLDKCEEYGVKVMPDIHSAEVDNSGHNKPLWYTDKVSIDEYYASLKWLANHYKNNDTIVAIDLKNEPHGQPNESAFAMWNDEEVDNNWKYVAEKAANIVLSENPNVLVMIEGVEAYPMDLENNSDYHVQPKPEDPAYYSNWWGGNLRGVADYPVELGKHNDKIVYSPHDYGPLVYQQSWFYDGFDYDSLINDCWQDNWLYIQTTNIAPLLIGEWGGFIDNGPNSQWMSALKKLIKTYHINHTFWCYNPNSGDTGGLVDNDFVTWDEEKYSFVKDALWREDGKFVGLNHDVPLGSKGISLSEAKGL